ncbi:hypothetical protein MSSIT_1849 [Methanosarcina siciliae T4/M]|uniref:Uncharacterized protein n=2 Tax=Methanosarcina siciliae TaxID=38027 RepID=A0A0E3PED3_9EURY|nr:hypothetical protein MSSIT_1849 [Methanosarcina siciliae T4/M]AKB32479.1 hypothetical protein MSSIH_1789 [Methanosarcina siciliae HI350]
MSRRLDRFSPSRGINKTDPNFGYPDNITRLIRDHLKLKLSLNNANRIKKQKINKNQTGRIKKQKKKIARS